MTEDNRRDELIRNAASEYNRPPATPRDEMWEAIQAARSNAGPRLRVAAGGASRLEHTGYQSRNRFASRLWWGAAAAAVLLVAAGVGIGRWTSAPGTSSPTTAVKQPIAVAVNPALPVPSTIESAPVSPPALPSASTERGTSAATNESKGRTRDEIRRSPHIVGTSGLRLASEQGNVRSSQRDFSGINALAVSYQVVTQRHLADTEALLTSFSLEGRDARMDAHFAGWAKGLLSNTRLLLDSPAGDDPRRARLLQDLELVLAQIVQLSPNAQAQDRELIQGSIQDGQLMTRLRSAIPAGQARGITEK